MLRHEIRCECLADGTEYPLIKTVKDKQNRNNNNILYQRKTKISD